MLATVGGLFGTLFVGNLVLLHAKLISQGLTTRENCNDTYLERPNPFDKYCSLSNPMEGRHTCINNCEEALGKGGRYPAFYSADEEYEADVSSICILLSSSVTSG